MASDPERRLESKDLPSIRWLGKGLSGYVYETTWLGNRYTRKDFPLGSVKRNYVFENEAKSLVDLDHPNIVKCFGYTVGNSSCSLLQEYVDDNLQSAIEKRIETRRMMKLSSSSSASQSRILNVDEINHTISNQAVVGSKMSESAIPFQLPEMVDIMSQIASGMKYLHDNEIAHGDLKPNNVLLHYLKPGQLIVKVADYGLVETKKRIKLVPKRTRHFEALMWKAPERLDELLGPLTKHSDDPFTESDTDSDEEMESYEIFPESRLAMADVYSFGLICLHILGEEPMYPGLSLTQLREERIKLVRLEPASDCPKNLKFIISSSLEPQPFRRLTFFDICSLLKTFQSEQLRTVMKGISTATASNFTAGSISTMDALSDELVGYLFSKLPLFDLLRARAVCKRWLEIAAQSLHTFDSQDDETSKSYCPLVFKRNSLQHLWWGYDSATGAWEPLPPLTNLPQVDIRPLAGNGKSLMGFKITSVPSQVVVGNPFTSEWLTIPKSTETWGEVGNILVVERSVFRIIAVREDATEIFHSKGETWSNLRQRPPLELHELAVLSMKDKLISATLSRGLLFCYGGNALISFDVVEERWREDHIRLPPHVSSKCFQMLECGGNLFVAIEDVAKGTISIWGLGLCRREFFAVVDMPPQLYSMLCKKKSRGGRHARMQLKAVGHKHRMYFWRNSSSYIVMFHYLRRTWAELPQFEECLRHAPGDQSDPEEFQTFIDTGSFEP